MNLHNAEFIRSVTAVADCPKDGLPQIAFAGKSNVGKSSVINKLLLRKNFARVGEAPGKTTHINFFRIDNKLYLVDLPGYGYARRSESERRVWAGLTNDYLESGMACAVFQLIDLKVGPTEDDCMMIEWLNANAVPYLVVATKSDKLNTTARNSNFDALCSHPLLSPPYAAERIRTILFSSQTGIGKNELLTAVSEYIR